VGGAGPATCGAAIAVGFAVAGGGTSALLWAVEEADRTGRELRLVNAADEAVTRRRLETWRREVGALVRHLALPGVEYRLGSGPAAEVLLAAVDDAALLVVGRRGGARSGRGDGGGTAAVLAQHCPLPLIVVPQQWSQASTFSAPVVVDQSALDQIDDWGRVSLHGTLHFALERATRYRVPLVIITAVPVQPRDSVSDGAGPAWVPDSSGNEVDGRLSALRRTHAGVEIASRSLSGSTEDALLELSGLAQLVVVHRSAAGAPRGLRHLLRGSSAPVAVIPPLL
jgi:nucleotide-binding universal stress UspA family protein